jgi:low affinity Fe/Cu permease
MLAGGTMRPTKPRSWFTRLTKATAHASGRPFTFILAVSVVVVWAALVGHSHLAVHNFGR